MTYDAVLEDLAASFIERLRPEEREDCVRTILDSLCPLVSPDDSDIGFPYRPGIKQRAIGQWHFWYSFTNSQVIGIIKVYYSTSNPKHPLYSP